MNSYIGDSVFYNKEIFTGYNISIPGLTSREIFYKVNDHPAIWGCFDKVVVSSMGNDMLKSMDLGQAKDFLKKTIDILLDAGAKKIMLIELPQIISGIPSMKHDNRDYLELARDYDEVFLVSDVYRQQLKLNTDEDGVHLNKVGQHALQDMIEYVSHRGEVYHHILESTSNHLGADMLERSGIDIEFAEYLLTNCHDWVSAAEKTIEAGYTDLVGIIGQYDDQTLYENFIDIY
jgi:hypothetical protein